MESLPLEILYAIFKMCDIVTRTRLARVCHDFKDIEPTPIDMLWDFDELVKLTRSDPKWINYASLWKLTDRQKVSTWLEY